MNGVHLSAQQLQLYVQRFHLQIFKKSNEMNLPAE